MREPPDLLAARAHLSSAESALRSEDGLFDLEEGLALLETVAQDAATAQHRAVAVNLLATYSTRICETVKRIVDADPGLPEPELEHLFRVLLAFDSIETELPAYARSLKVGVVRRLIDLYYEGHSAAEKRKMLEQLANLADGSRDR